MEKVKKIKDPNKVTLLEKSGFLTFSMSTNVIFNFKSLFYNSFLIYVLDLSPGTAALILGLGTIWDAINDPLIATFCANRKFKSGERIRPYALVACIPWAITIVLMFTNFRIGNEVVTAIVCTSIYFVFEALYTFLCMPYNSLASVATKDDYQRKSINSFRSLGGCFGSAIGALSVLSLVELFGADTSKKDESGARILNPNDSKAFFYVAIIMGVICIIGSLYHYFTSKERIKTNDEKQEKISIIKSYKMLFGCKSWVLNTFYILGYGVTSALMMNNINIYATHIMGDVNNATPILAAYLVAAVLISVVTPIVDKKIGRRNTMLLALLILALGKIPFILDPRSPITIYINAVTTGIGATATFVLFNTNRNAISDILEVQNGRRIDTLVGGGDNLIAKLAEAAAIMGFNFIYEATGFNSKVLEQNAPTENAIFAFLGWVPLILAGIMAVFAFFINTKKEMEESIAKRDAQLAK